MSAVIAYHLGAPLPGGFLGVDIFFVLSGYLITSLLLHEHRQAGRIDLPAFWARRARRLVPALLLLVTACAFAASRGPILDLDARRGDMLATLTYYANWHFLQTGQSYFDSFKGASPLRHAWSLAVEEQFYIFWPLVAAAGLALIRRAWVLGLLVVAAAAASAVQMALVFDIGSPSRAYLGTDVRMHQLLIGAVLALLVVRGRVCPEQRDVSRLVQLAGLVGLLLLVGALASLNDKDPVYSHGGSLAVSLAVAAVLLAVEVRPAGPLARALGLPPVAWVGRISYGLYLWHWPMLIWLGDGHAGSFSAKAAGGVLATTALVALLSYRLVEHPIRNGRGWWIGRSSRRLIVAVPVALALVAGVAIQATADPRSTIARQIKNTSVTPCPGRQSWCERVRRPAATAPLVAVIGDSTALALDPGMRDAARHRGFGYVQAGRNGCSFLPIPFGLVPGRSPSGQVCAAGAASLLGEVQRQMRPDVWLISDRFMLLRVMHKGQVLESGSPEHNLLLARTLRTTIEQLTAGGARVVLLVPPPPGDPVDCALDRRESSCGLNRIDPARAYIRPLLDQGVAGRGAVVSVDDVLCVEPGGGCGPVIDGVLVRYDGIHYTATYSRTITTVILGRAAAAGVPVETLLNRYQHVMSKVITAATTALCASCHHAVGGGSHRSASPQVGRHLGSSRAWT